MNGEQVEHAVLFLLGRKHSWDHVRTLESCNYGVRSVLR